VKDEIEFSILRISEKRYKAEAEVELLTKQLAERDAEIAALKAQVQTLSQENTLLKATKKGGMVGSNTTSPRRAMPGVSDRSVTELSLISLTEGERIRLWHRARRERRPKRDAATTVAAAAIQGRRGRCLLVWHGWRRAKPQGRCQSSAE